MDYKRLKLEITAAIDRGFDDTLFTRRSVTTVSDCYMVATAIEQLVADCPIKPRVTKIKGEYDFRWDSPSQILSLEDFVKRIWYDSPISKKCSLQIGGDGWGRFIDIMIQIEDIGTDQANQKPAAPLEESEGDNQTEKMVTEQDFNDQLFRAGTLLSDDRELIPALRHYHECNIDTLEHLVRGFNMSNRTNYILCHNSTEGRSHIPRGSLYLLYRYPSLIKGRIENAIEEEIRQHTTRLVAKDKAISLFDTSEVVFYLFHKYLKKPFKDEANKVTESNSNEWVEVTEEDEVPMDAYGEPIE